MTDNTSAAPTYEQVIAAWNAQADKYNQWGELGEDEKIEWAVACVKATPPAVVVPLTDEQIVGVMHSIPINAAPSYHIAFARAIAQAHGIKGGQHDAE